MKIKWDSECEKFFKSSSVEMTATAPELMPP